MLDRLVEARRAAGITQKDLAERIAKPQSHVSKCESREREIDLVTLYYWVEALGLSFAEVAREWADEVGELNRQPSK